ncbi:SGNH/GDSL hydrolase family protein [Paenibacillus sinopodophylli]|uniref:SGNH/GDSL hydrolase family protein n=1 Tax=Paenibacillus sinopodophylli TaxID=1837342 RepID=UPI00110CDC57|nr:SGNH/GDSL hydrolase family protein [Paenibacillus sinopodophylli]
MIKQNIYFHNVTELEPCNGGVYLRRWPSAVRHAMGDRGRFIAEEATGCELRFVTAAKYVRVTVGIPETDGIVKVFKGGLFHSEHKLQAGGIRTLHLEEPSARFAMVDRKHLLESGFAPEIWRICFGNHAVIFYSLNTFGCEVRLPQAGEMPRRRWLAYGSSITHGLDNFPLSYIHQAARRMKLDVMNAGMSGSCLCEPEVADFMAGRDDWQVATLELGVNMRDSMSDEQFESKTSYLLEKMVARHPDKPIFLITIYPNFATYAGNAVTERDQRFNEILRSHVARLRHPLLHLIEGEDVMQDMSGMTCDLIHPGEYGHMRMGEQLAQQMIHLLL